MKIAVQMDAPDTLNPAGDSTIALMREAAKRGYHLYYYRAHELTLCEGDIIAPLRLLHINNGEEWYDMHPPVMTSLHAMDAVLMRQDPPFDMGYITATYMLDRLDNVIVLNDPTSVRSYPEKLLPFDYIEAMPDTLITMHQDIIRDFLSEHQDIILKPLYGWGGHSVLRLRHGGDNVEALLEMLQERDTLPVIAQPFLPDVSKADIRVVLINGKNSGAFARTPMQGEVRANMRVGGQPVEIELNEAQQTLCHQVAADLKDKGLYFAGLDFIGNMLTEINVTSPTGIKTIETLYGTSPAADFWDGVTAAP